MKSPSTLAESGSSKRCNIIPKGIQIPGDIERLTLTAQRAYSPVRQIETLATWVLLLTNSRRTGLAHIHTVCEVADVPDRVLSRQVSQLGLKGFLKRALPLNLNLREDTLARRYDQIHQAWMLAVREVNMRSRFCSVKDSGLGLCFKLQLKSFLHKQLCPARRNERDISGNTQENTLQQQRLLDITYPML